MHTTWLCCSWLIACNQSGQEKREMDEPSESVSITHEQFETSQMELGTMVKKSFSRSVKVNGYIDVPPERKASVSVKLGGFVRSLSILPGDKVTRGKVLFSLENPDFIQLQQDYLEAKAQLQYLESDYERQKSLASENIASQKNYLKAESDYKVTQAKYQGLREKLKLLNINTQRLEDGTIEPTINILAPISGYISKVNITRGIFVAPADIAVEIVDTEHMHVELQVFEKDIASIEKDQPLTFILPGSGSRTYKGEVYLVGKTIENETRTVNVHGHIEDEQQIKNLLPGMYVEATIDIAGDTLLAIPSGAVVSSNEKYYVLVQTRKDAAGYNFNQKEVTTGAVSNQWTEVINAADFKPDDIFLVKGAFNLIRE